MNQKKCSLSVFLISYCQRNIRPFRNSLSPSGIGPEPTAFATLKSIGGSLAGKMKAAPFTLGQCDH
jgi:hypothetical protein